MGRRHRPGGTGGDRRGAVHQGGGIGRVTSYWEQTAELVPEPPAGAIPDGPHPDGMPNGTDAPNFWVSLLAERARQPEGRDVAPAAATPTKEKKPGTRLAVQIPPRPIEQTPPRPWAYGFYMMRGQAAVLGARDGGGKG